MIKEMMQTIENTKSFSTTENGAIGHITTGSKLVDLNFRVPSMRLGFSHKDIEDFIQSMNENLEYAVKWMFYVRDVRGGLGERDTFIRLYSEFYTNHKNEAKACLDLISEYGRWKDVVDLAFVGNEELENDCLEIIKNQLKTDAIGLAAGKPISLLAKWLPSINASQKAREQAKKICSYLGMPFVSYRKMLSKFRAYLDVTEVKTCANQWGGIDYNKVSSNANLKYSNAFMRHDEARRLEYLSELNSAKENPKVKMNASVLYPYEIWAKYNNGVAYADRWYCCGDNTDNVIDELDPSLEAMWENLKEMGSCGNTMCIVDGSGSMNTKYTGISAKPIDIARSLGTYFAERCTGEFHNMMIEFSSRPQIIDINGCETLMDKINHISKYRDCSNTDIEKTFMLILDTAVKNHMSQEDMPERLLIVSDMEFDGATCTRKWEYATLFDTISERFRMHGYKMPKLVFWNVASRTNTIPVKENDLGVILVSGFSVNIVNMVLSGETDPWFALKDVLDNERYNQISDKLNSVNNE